MARTVTSVFRACWQLALLASASLVLGCTLEDRPSLGVYEPTPPPASSMPAGDDPKPAPAGAISGTGGVSAPSRNATSADGGSSLTMPPPADAAGLGPPANADAGRPDAAAPELHCAGVYMGDFACVFSQSITNPMTDAIPVALTLRQSQGVEIASASAQLSFALSGFIFAADIAGQLDCKTNAFHAVIVNGIFAAALAPVPLPFDGTIDGQLDSTTKKLAGDWSFTAPGGQTCMGTWGAALQP